MKTILLVAEFIPGVNINGSSLPIDGLYRELSKVFIVDFLLVHHSDKYFEQHEEIIKDAFGKVYVLKRQHRTKRAAFYDEVVKGKMNFLNHSYELKEVRELMNERHWDLIWAGSLGAMSFVEFCKNHRLIQHSKILLSALDVTTFAMRNIWIKLVSSDLRYINLLHLYFRSFILQKTERRMFLDSDIVHVVSENEKQKALLLINSSSTQPDIVVAPNGINQKFAKVSYHGKSNVLLFMTNLESNYVESRWFFKKVWPLLESRINAEVWIVGPTNRKNVSWLNSNRIKIKGFCDCLEDILAYARIFILPTHHDVGYINRLADALVAGVPIVTTSYPAKSFPSLVNDRDLIIEDDPSLMAKKINSLYNDASRRLKLAHNAKLFAKDNMLSWKAASDILKLAIEKQVGGRCTN